MTGRLLSAHCILYASLILSPLATAQISDLMVNGSPTYFSMNSGDYLSWSFTLPVGGSAEIEVWIDVDADTAIDPATDRVTTLLRQIDGSLVSEGKLIPDFDLTVDGSIHFGMPAGIAPARYVLKVSNGGMSATIGGIVTRLFAPSFTVSGTVSGPAGSDLGFILMSASRDGSYPLSFWNALTDSGGHYSIEMNDDTAGNPWGIGIDNVPRGYLVTSPETMLTITGNHVGIDFTLVEPGAEVGGYVLTEGGDSLHGVLLTLERLDPGWSRTMGWTFSDHRGSYWAGVFASDLNGSHWRIVQPYSSEPTTTRMMGMRKLSPYPFNLVRDVTVYETNSTVRGRVLLDGSPPGFSVMMFTENEDTARSWAPSDPATGDFSIPVSGRISRYVLKPYNLIGPYSVPVVAVAPGDTGVLVEIVMTEVAEGTGRLPRDFSLSQNFPNPFNPVTSIGYTLPAMAHVTIAVFDILGRRVALLAHEVTPPGDHTVTFDGSGLPGGIYICRMTAGAHSEARKMLLVK